MKQCIKLLISTFKELARITLLLTEFINNKNPGSNDLTPAFKYRNTVAKFQKYCETLTPEKFQEELKYIYQNSMKIIKVFSNQIIPMIERNDATELSKDMINLIKQIQLLLTYLSKYVKDENDMIMKYQNKLIDKSKEYIQVAQENHIPFLSEEFASGMLSGFSRVFVSSFKVLTFKEKHISDTLDTTNNYLRKLNARMDNTIMKIGSNTPGSVQWQYIKEYFTSSEFGATIGGLIGIAAIFILVRKAFLKTVRFIKEKWNDFWEWARS